MVSIEFYGAARTVTGSNYVVRTDKASFLVDCGMFQGPDVESRNLEDYEYDASKINFVLLTHAHIDHSGMLPKVYKEGFRGPIYATNNTIQITGLLLMDSAKIQENNFQSGESYGKYTLEKGIAFNTDEATNTIGLFKAIDFKDEFSPAEGVKVRYIRAGHILGAASIEVTINDEGKDKVIIFSGDLGRVSQPLIPSYDKDYKATPDFILMESLYGGIEHPDRQESIDQLLEIIKKTMARNGTVFIPSFAVQRTQELLHDFRQARDQGKLDKNIPIWLDSPLAQRVCQIYTEALQDTPESSFMFEGLQFVKKYRQSQKLSRRNKQIIIAGSGMADGGRIVDHLASGLLDSKNSIVFVGYQAEGTMGRELVQGASSVQIGKTKINVKAEVYQLKGFSAHGDTSDYLGWVKRFNSDNLKNLFLIHAEEERSMVMKDILTKEGFKNLTIPYWKQTIELK